MVAHILHKPTQNKDRNTLINCFVQNKWLSDNDTLKYYIQK